MNKTLSEIKKQFPAATIRENGMDIEFHIIKDELIIHTPDRSEVSAKAVQALKAAGLSGIWRARK